MQATSSLPAYLSPAALEAWIIQSLQEDVGDGDHTSLACIPATRRSKARLLVKDAGVLAGIEVARRIFRHVDPAADVKILMRDGMPIHFGDVAFEVDCNSQALLQAERLILNTMQRMSGIATLSNRFLFEVEDLPVTILDTRKTTPLFRAMEKWAVAIGGCSNYRFGLFDRIMVKDNHVEASGGIRQAIERVRAYQEQRGVRLPITVEVRNLVELYEVLEVGGVDRIMLDNFEKPLLSEAVAIVNGRYETEASGGVTIHTVREIAKSGVNFVSTGALTHSAVSLDLSLKIFQSY